jgi:hypothetical protein
MDFILNGSPLSVDRKQVERALRDVEPEVVRKHSVTVNGRAYPVKQVFHVITGIDSAEFTSHRARDVLRRLGFEVGSAGDRPPAIRDMPRTWVLRLISGAGGTQECELSDEFDASSLQKALPRLVGSDEVTTITAYVDDAVGGVGVFPVAWRNVMSATVYERVARVRRDR